MMDSSLILKIKQLRTRGQTYEEIAEGLHLSYSTISKALKGGESKPVLLKKNTTLQPALHFSRKPSYIGDNASIRNNSVLARTESVALGGIENPAINKKATKLIYGPDGCLYRAPIDNPGRSSNSIINTPLPSWFWKIFFLFIGVVLFIWVLRRVKGYDEATL